MNDFEKWWHNEGSGMRPADNEDMEEFAKRITSIAWSNGKYLAEESCIKVAMYNGMPHIAEIIRSRS